MHLVLRVTFAALFCVFVGFTGTHAYTIDFEDLPEETWVTGQYATLGVTFAGGIISEAGSTLFEDEFPPLSGTKVLVTEQRSLTVTLSDAAQQVQGYFTYTAPLTIDTYDTAGVLLGSVSSLFSCNAALIGDVGSSPNEAFTFSSPAGISSIVVSAGAGQGFFTLDDLSIVVVPEASPLVLCGISVLGLVLALGRNRILFTKRLSFSRVDAIRRNTLGK
jgi:hypothetical protein